MDLLNLSPSFAPFGPGMPFDSFTFSGGEPHVKLTDPQPREDILITARIRRFEDLGTLLMVTDALRRSGTKYIRLFLPYFPGARQDRVAVPGEPLTAKVYASLLNSQHYSEVTVFDPHSDVTAAVLDNVRVIPNHEFIRFAAAGLEDYLLVSPDGGALKKISALAEVVGRPEVLECSKHRDIRNGKLSEFRVPLDHLGGRPCLIADDICDGGMTFLGLAAALKKHGAGPLYLAVSHGIFSKGYDALGAAFTKIFTTDSFYEGSDPRVQVVPLQSFMRGAYEGLESY